MQFSIYHYAMHIMHTQINNLIIADLLIFQHTLSKGSEQFFQINRVSPAKHCRKRHVSTELK